MQVTAGFFPVYYSKLPERRSRKDFLAYTFGGSTVTYDNALKNGGVVTTYAPAGESAVYQEGVEYFNDQRSMQISLR